jgi:mono/diheme cytochrome c family protein
MRMIQSGLVAAMVAAGALTVGAAAARADEAKIKRGMEVYAEQKCSLCHSIADKGNKKGPLDGVGSKLSEADIKEWIVNPKGMTEKTKATRKPPMKAYPNLPAADLEALVEYLDSLKK